MKIALIPGSFKPPHRGHYEMIQYYSNLVGNDGKVIVFVSDPKQKVRMIDDTRFVTADVSIKILQKYCENLKNVEIRKSEVSPVTDCYEFAKVAGEVEIIPGASNKGKDVSRWKNMQAWLIKNGSRARIIDHIAPVSDNLSSSDLRKAIAQNDLISIQKFIPKSFRPEEFLELIQ